MGDRTDNKAESNNALKVTSVKGKGISGRMLLFVGISLIIAFLACAIILVYPLFKNPWMETFDRLLFEHEITDDFAQALQAKGKSVNGNINIPNTTTYISFAGELKDSGEYKDKNSVCMLELDISDKGTAEQKALKLGWSREKIFLVYSVYGTSELCVEIPRTNVSESLSSSVFHPDSSSKYALTTEQYNDLLSALRMIETDDKNERPLSESFKRVLLSVVKKAEIKSRYKLFDGGFNISNTVTLKLDRDAFSALIDAAISESEENSAINKQISVQTIEEALDIKLGNSIKTASDAFRWLKAELADHELELELSYTACNGKIRDIKYCLKHADKDSNVIRDMNVSFTYQRDMAEMKGVELVSENGVNRERSITLKRSYNKNEELSEITVNTESYGTQVTVKFEYEHNGGKYSLGHYEAGDEWSVGGELLFDVREQKLTLTVNNIYFNKITMTTEGNFIDVTLSPSYQTLSIPSGDSLFSMTAAEMDILVENLIKYFK